MRPLTVISAAAVLVLVHTSSLGQQTLGQRLGQDELGQRKPVQHQSGQQKVGQPKTGQKAPPGTARSVEPLLLKPAVHDRLDDPIPRIALVTLGPIMATDTEDQASRVEISGVVDQQVAVTGLTLFSPPSLFEGLSTERMLRPLAGPSLDWGAGPGPAGGSGLNAWPAASAASLMAVVAPAGR